MRERAKLVGGKLDVWSEIGSGTEVDFKHPSLRCIRTLSRSPQVLAIRDVLRVAERNEFMSADPKSIRILAVDDHPLVRQGISGLIAVQSYMSLVAEASNGRDAIQQFRAHRPDITLMDLQMPEMNGLDAIIAIRNEFPEARIVVLTTYTGDVQILRALKAGARAYLLKISCIRNCSIRSALSMLGKRLFPLRPPSNLPSTSPMTLSPQRN